MNELKPNLDVKHFLLKGLGFLCLWGIILGSGSIHAQTRLDDSLTLVQFYQSTGGTGWTNTWNFIDPMDNWYGVTVDYFGYPGGRVTCLDLDGSATCASGGSTGNNLTGSLTDLQLTECKYLYLSANDLSGPIPNFTNLPQLIRMNLHNNDLTGTIPNFQNMPVLTDIRLENNQLSGSVPNFNGVPDLNNLRLQSNLLTGTIPDFSSIPNLVHLFLYDNDLVGGIPNFSNLPAMEYLFLHDNGLSGNVPDLSGVPTIKSINLRNNLLSGSIPDFPNAPALLDVNLGFNQLTGSIPDFSNVPVMYRLFVFFNQLSGPIPDFSNAPSLQDLHAYKNQLSGPIPDFSNTPFLRELFLYDNQLSGPLPNFTSATGLRYMNLHTNNLSGTIPNWNLPDLQDIYLSDNNLTGSIPDFNSLPNLLYLKIARNDLDLPVPAFNYFSFLFEIDLIGNQLTFEDLESSTFANQTLANGGYEYSNQDSIGIEQTITLSQGGTYTINLNIDNNVNNSTYTWYRNGTFLTTTNVNNITISNFQTAYEGDYHCLITNTSAPLLTLFSRTTTLLLDNSCSLDLIATFPDCGASVGSIQSAVTNAPGAIYTWSTGATTPNINGLSPGTYTLTVTETSGSCNTFKSAIISPAGEPEIEWQKTYGGSLNENAESISYTSDGHIIVSGRSYSGNGDVGQNKGNSDFWIIKTDNQGNLLGANTWKTVLGGSNVEYALDHQETADGGVIVAGYTQSDDQDVTGFHGSIDSWIVKLDAIGNLEWQKALGGSNSEIATSIEQTADGGYIVGGWSNSNDGDVSQNSGNVDYWVVKLDAQGAIEWERSYGGTQEDNLTSIEIAPTGGYFIGGFTYSDDGDLLGLNKGLADYWVLHIDEFGAIIWSETYGGPFEDKLAELKVTQDGGLAMIGWTNSVSGQITNNWGGEDVWFVKTDPTGNLMFQNTMGTRKDDKGQYIIPTDDHAYLITGYTDTTELDVTGNNGDMDYWVVKLEHTGQIEWQKSLGGSSYEFGFACDVAEDGGYLVAGWTNSNDIDVSGNNGNEDFWVVKLNEDYPISTSFSIQDVSCFGGNNGYSVVTPQGGTSPYTYLWSTGSSLDSIWGLSTGNYIVTVLDNNSCQHVSSIFIGQPPAATLTISVLTTSQCDIACSAEASVQVSGNGTPPYGYLWDNGSTSQIATSLCAGFRVVTVTDFEGCTIGVDSVFINPVSGLNVVISELKPISCVPGNDGVLLATGTGNNPPFTYNWDNVSTTPSISNLTPGTYTVTVTDVDGCFITSQYVMSDPLPISISLSPFNTSCPGGFDGSIFASPAGQAPYSYLWSNGAQSGTISNLTAGTYFVTVFDNEGCIGTASTTVSDGVNPMNSTITQIGKTCFDSTVVLDLEITGGTLPYAYLWTNGTTNTSIIDLPVDTSGTYIVNVTDAVGCIQTDFQTINFSQEIVTTIIINDSISCSGNSDGVATVTASAGLGSGDFTFIWDNGFSEYTTYTFLSTATGLSPGLHTVTVIDMFTDSCSTVVSFTMPISSQTLMLDSVAQTNPTCQGNNGSFAVVVTGGTPPYQYSLDGTNWQSNNAFIGLTQGGYSVYFEDDNQCLDSTFVNLVDQNGPVIDSLNIFHPHCQDADGTLGIVATGNGQLEYSLDGTNWQTITFFDNLSAGIYSVFVRDANLCTTSTTDTLVELAGPAIDSVTFIEPICNSSNGSISIFGSGSLGPYDYKLDNGSFQPLNFFSGLSQGPYQVFLRDRNGCLDSLNVILPGTDAPSIDTIQITNPNCQQSDGSMTIQVTGGNPPYQFNINGGAFQTDSTFNNLPSGSYTITIKDTLNCTITALETLIDLSGPTLDSVQLFDPHCQDTDGTISMFTSGNPPFEYSLDSMNWQTQSFFPNLTQGTYTIYIRDANQCIAITNQTLADLPGPTIDSVTFIEPICSGANGTITIFGSGSLGPYDYKLDNGNYQPTSFFSGLSQGNYQVFLRDRNGCADSLTVTLPGTDAPAIDTILKTNPNCQQSDGSMIIQATGGNPPYEFSVNNSPFQTDSLFSNLPAGSYSITVQDALNCTVGIVESLIDNSGPIVDSVNLFNPHCQDSDGTISLFVSGTPPFDYSLDSVNWQTQPFFPNLTAGTYTVYILDVNQCLTISTQTLVDLPGPVIDSVTFVEPVCNGSNGTITIFGSGSLGPYDYKLDNGSFQNQSFFSGLNQGNYQVFLRDVNGCLDSLNVILPGSDAPTINTILKTNPNCGQSDGSMVIQATGGLPPYEFSVNNSPFQTDSTFINLASGNYTITVRDSLNCTVTAIDSLQDTSSPNIDSVNTTSAVCQGSNGSITIFASGGTAPLEYSMDGVNYGPSNVFNNIAAGPYTVYVSDDNNCNDSTTISITNLDGPTIDSLNTSNPVCQGSNGSITVFASGGTVPLEYSLDNASYQPSNAFTGLTQGVYSVYARDDNGCVDSTQTTLSELTGPSIDSISMTPANCGNSDGTLTIHTTGGTLPLTYIINGASQATNLFTGPSGTYTIEVTDVNGCSQTASATIDDQPWTAVIDVTIVGATCGQQNGSIVINAPTGVLHVYSIDNGATTSPSNTFANLAPGPYHVWVANVAGCIVDSMVTLPAINPPMIDSMEVKDAVCNLDNGEVTVYTSAGTAPIEYSIDNGTTWQSSPVFDSLAAGGYTITVRDSTNCVISQSTSIANHPPPTFGLLQGVTPSNCGQADGRIVIISGLGGTLPFQYSLDSGMTFQLSDTFPNLLAGTYDAVILDSNGCEVHKPLTLTDKPGPVLQALNIQQPACNMASGSLELSPTGSDFEYNINGGSFTTNNVFNGLVAGQHSFIINNALTNCSDTLTVTLIDQLAPDIGSINVQQSSCGSSNGGISVSVINGLPPFIYSIDNGVNWQASNVFNGLSANTYQIIVEDKNLCRDTSQFIVISNPGSPVIDSLSIDEPACNQNNGVVTVHASGGNPPLLYSLDGVNFQLSNVFINLPSGPNTIFVFDSTACQTDTIVTLVNQAGPDLDSIFIDHPDCSMNNGVIELFGSGGNPPYQYSIDNGASFSSSNQFISLVASTYQVVIKDDRDCEVSGTAVLQNQAGPQIDSIEVTPADCIANTGSLTIIAAGGNPPYNYNWNTTPVQTGMTATALSPGQYIVTVSDSNNCTTVATGIVPAPIPEQVDLGTDFAACGLLNQVLDAGPGNGYVWSTGDTTQTIVITSYGIYGVTLTDVNNCVTTDSIEIEEILFNPAITNDTTILVGDPIQLEASGGLNYEWWPGTDLSCVFCPDPVATPMDSITYYVEISATNNCVDTLSVHVDLFNINNPPIEPPNVFTCNEDGINDCWVIPLIEFYENNRVFVVNRWGDLVFEAFPYRNDWYGTSSNGKPLPQGTYYYYIELDVNRVNTLKGTVTIIR